MSPVTTASESTSRGGASAPITLPFPGNSAFSAGPKELPPNELPAEPPKELPKAAPQELPKERPNERPPESPQELPRDRPQELPKELPRELDLSLRITDPELITELTTWPTAADRNEYAGKALRIGVLALKQARGNVDADTVRREGDRLLSLLQERLESHSRLVNDRMAGSLKDYFDPESGRFHERVKQLVSHGGELEQVLSRQVSADNSELSKTLTQFVGSESVLMKMLSPDQSQGLLATLRDVVDEQLATQRTHVLNQFSLDNKEGALSRFLSELTERTGDMSEALQGKIETVVNEFSLDNQESALNRLMANMDLARKTITREFSMDDNTSALSRLGQLIHDTQTTLTGNFSLDNEDSALARLKKELLLLLESQRDHAQKFQEEVRITLREMVARKEEAARSTRHGLAFEEEVVTFVARLANSQGDFAEATGNRTGVISNCKVGDVVVTLGADSAAAGAKIVVEAKEVQSYTLTDAIKEMDIARSNRGAQTGLFCFSKKTAPAVLETVFRHGNDVFVVWDAEDPETDLYLRTGLMLAKALVMQAQRAGASSGDDLQQLEKAILDLEKSLSGFDELRTAGEAVGKQSEKILERVRIMLKNQTNQLEKLKDAMTGLKECL